jgi:hypothetical protein
MDFKLVSSAEDTRASAHAEPSVPPTVSHLGAAPVSLNLNAAVSVVRAETELHGLALRKSYC